MGEAAGLVARRPPPPRGLTFFQDLHGRHHAAAHAQVGPLHAGRDGGRLAEGRGRQGRRGRGAVRGRDLQDHQRRREPGLGHPAADRGLGRRDPADRGPDGRAGRARRRRRRHRRLRRRVPGPLRDRGPRRGCRRGAGAGAGGHRRRPIPARRPRGGRRGPARGADPRLFRRPEQLAVQHRGDRRQGAGDRGGPARSRRLDQGRRRRLARTRWPKTWARRSMRWG